MPMNRSDPIRCGRTGTQPTAATFLSSLEHLVRPPQQLDRDFAVEIERLAPKVGIDPAFVFAQWWHETDAGRSSRWHRDHNPAGIGIPAATTEQPTPIADGIEAARCHLIALCIVLDGKFPNPQSVPFPPATESFFEGMRHIAQSLGRPDVVTIDDFNLPFVDQNGESQFTFAEDALYEVKLSNRGNEIFPSLGSPTTSVHVITIATGTWTAALSSNGILRESPTRTGTRLAKLLQGTSVLLTGVNDGGFLSVEVGGKKGWLHHRHLVAKASTNLPIRRRATFESEVVESVPPGTIVDLDGRVRLGFVEIYFQGGTGWVFSNYLRVAGRKLTDAIPGVQAVAAGLGGDPLIVRNAPLIRPDTAIGALQAGDSVTLTGPFKPGFASINFEDERRWVLTEQITGDSVVTSATLTLQEEMRRAGMRISQGPFESFTHSICDCFDLAVPEETPIHSIAPGRVLRSVLPTDPETDDFTYRPNFVDVKTEFGVIRYAHLNSRAVNEGDGVERNTFLGMSGTAGTGPHLHLQLNGGKDGPFAIGLTLTEILRRVGFDLASFPRDG